MGGNSTIYTYTYDYRNYITDINVTGSEEYGIHYAYDELGQLIREDNEKLGKTFVHTYGPSGNILETKTYGYTNPDVTPSGTCTIESYVYGHANWRDRLSAYNGTTITYDAIGNPLSYYGNRTFAWEGRQMTSATTASSTLTFKYNDNGLRVFKAKDGIQTVYYYDGTRLVAEKNENETIIYIYDDYGAVIGMQYRLTTYAEDTWDVYWFERNLQGDIVAVYNTTGTKLISYTYDAWGNFTAVYSNGGENTTAVKNPFRYRGYYYDSDLQLYYLQTRYYDSVTGRFISADSYISTGQGVLGNNMFAYCNNNPVMHIDPSGEFPWIILAVLAATTILGGILGACSDVKIGEAQIEDTQNIEDEDSAQEPDELTGWDRARNIVIGAGLGLTAGGAVLAVGGVATSLAAAGATTLIVPLGVTGAQLYAIGALFYNTLPMIIAPFVNIQPEPMEYPGS